ncbi:MAG: hypothetical protein FWD52_07130 [Candidatus Bathyarchaeota archaeon]|nr:hypothetical protein [Candidatus Termiticorpusculum sp.]
MPVDDRSPYVSGSVVQVLDQGDMVKEGYVFLGWATNPATTKITHAPGSTFNLFSDTVLYAVWQPEKENDLTVPYTVHYYLVDTTIILTTSKTGTGIMGTLVTENAPAIEGYVALNPTSVTVTLNAADNVFTFYYTERTDIEYRVNYLEQGTGRVLATQKVVTDQTFNTSVSESAIAISGYAAANSSSIVTTLNATNIVITFYYTTNTTSPQPSTSTNNPSSKTPPPTKTTPPPTSSTSPPPIDTTPPPTEKDDNTNSTIWASKNIAITVITTVTILTILAGCILLLRHRKQI